MPLIKKMMVALGFSDYAPEIFKFATQLATQLDADLVVADIINERDVAAVESIVALGYEVDGEHYVSSIQEERQQLLDQYLTETGFPGKRLETVFKVGNPIEELLKIIIEQDVQMVVMGVKGRSDLQRALVGSVAEKMFRRSPVTVVSFRDSKNARRLRKRINVD